MSEKHIKTYSADQIRRLGPGKTDWVRVDSLSDEEIEAAMRDDPDWAGLVDFDWSDAVVVVPRRKKAISIRLDEDVVDFFRAQGEGYQTRMNAVLRRFMEKMKKRDAAE
jgi:uncharacterized protein (DUF4415 family)